MARTGTEKFIAQGLVEFAKTHPIAALVEANIDDQRVARSRDHDRHTIRTAYRIYAGDLVKRHIDTDNANLAYCLDLTRYEAGNPIPANRFLTWYLPWNPGGGQTDMVLSQSPVLDNTGTDVNPSVFFTTQLTGCSVFVRGTQQKPQIFHNGTGGATPWEGTSSNHWRNLFALSKPKTFKKGTFSEVNANQYIGAKFLGKEIHSPHVQTYFNSIANQEAMYNPGGFFDVIKYMGTGCVFGVRDNTSNWSFYLQENFRIAYSRVPGQFKWANRVIRLWKVFPGRTLVHTNLIAKRLP